MTTTLASDELVQTIVALRAWARTHLGGKIITVGAGKGGVGKTTLAVELAYCLDAPLVDFDWDDGCATRALGWYHEQRKRSPLLDAIDSGRTPRPITGQSKPDIIPAGPELANNQPSPSETADLLVKWAADLGRPLLVDSHPGKNECRDGAMRAAHVVAVATDFEEKPLEALNGFCLEFAGYPLFVVPMKYGRRRGQRTPERQVARMARIVRSHGLEASTPIPLDDWVPHRPARTAICAMKQVPAGRRELIHGFASCAREVASRA